MQKQWCFIRKRHYSNRGQDRMPCKPGSIGLVLWQQNIFSFYCKYIYLPKVTYNFQKNWSYMIYFILAFGNIQLQIDLSRPLALAFKKPFLWKLLHSKQYKNIVILWEMIFQKPLNNKIIIIEFFRASNLSSLWVQNWLRH